MMVQIDLKLVVDAASKHSDSDYYDMLELTLRDDYER